MHKIVITGGPCAGKTDIMSHLIQKLEDRGYKVVIIPETATELILNGMGPSAAISMEEFQKLVLDLQLAKEDVFLRAIDYYDSDKVVVFYDRGILDSCAYVDMDPYFIDVLKTRNLTISDVYNRYDAVFHLVTAANGAEKYYQWNDPTKDSVGNNAARRESPEEAREKDDLTLNSWVGHPHLRVFDNSTDFNGKIKRVIDEVFAMIGEPITKEIERKFLIKRPTDNDLKNLKPASATNIIQTYLITQDGAERRIRQRGTNNHGYSFYYTEKSEICPGERIEVERRITKAEYIAYLAEADTSFHQISKTRYCFVYKNRYYELDIYPFSDEYAILEIELNDLNEEIILPPLTVIKEVTNDLNYRNSSLAKSLAFTVDGSATPVEVIVKK